mmetsp:Transcript_23734/g.23636  ORF Transcript_23734/g.23636 Transcript_23734/m.23636 type:complete len:172 (+) Transcript_23734:1806-2321(+)
MNRFKLLQEFTIFAQKKYNAENKGTRVFTADMKEVEDEKYEILLFLKLLIRDTLKEYPDLDKQERKSYSSGNQARYGFGIQLRKLYKKCEIEFVEKVKLVSRKTKADIVKVELQKKENSKFAKDTKFKNYAKQVKVSGRDKREKELMQLKYDRMNSGAMRKYHNEGNLEFM